LVENREISGSLYSTPPLRGTRRNISISFNAKKARMVWLPDSEKSLRIRLAVSTNYLSVTDGQTDRRTDRRTDILRPHTPRYTY